MAFSLHGIRSRLHQTLHGRRIGLTHDDYLGGPKDMLKPVSAATSDTTGTALAPYGVHGLATSAGDTWTLTDPAYAGQQVTLIQNSTYTTTHVVTTAAANIRTTAGSSFISAKMNAQGEGVTLVALSTSLWAVTSNVSAVTFTT